MTSQPSEDDAVDAATVPLNQVAVADLAAGAAAFDAWLRECSGGYVTLQRVKEVSAALPVLGNVIAAVDVCGDIATLIRNRNVKRAEIDQMLDWASLGINLIGVLPIPPGTAAARMTLRPTLGIVRQSVKNGAKELGAALVAVIAGHFTASLMGELQPFVEEAKARLKEVLAECGKEAEKHLSALAAALDAIASGRLTDPNANLRAASRKASRVSARALVHDPLDTLDNMLGAVWEVSKAGVKAEINAVVSCLPDAATGLIRTLAADVRDFIPVVKQQLARLSGDDVGTIMHMLNVLIQAIQTYEAKKHHVEATVKGNASNQARLNGEGGRTEASRYQAKTRKPGPSACKTCAKGQPAPGSTGSIGFALGDESFTHTDFVLPGVLAVEWVRAYRSNFDAHDTAGPLGPRWTTPFHASFEPGGDALIYHDASGRSVRYPLLVEGQSHYDPIERMTITRASGDEVSIGYSEQLTQTYVRYGKRFVLAKVADRAGNALTLAYTDGQLATLASSAGAVVGFTHDEAGRITHIALLDDKGQPIRTLAAYRYDDAGDLVGATDENGATRAYAYSHHLVTRYTDRTGRGMNLQWDGTHVDARAVREWADDGTFDTRLRWHDRLRLTFVTDARGNTTQQYYDIDGYPYRIVYPDRTEEWFFRDAAKNVVRHIFADGATEQFTWDGRGNLTSHTARDGRTAYYVHDERDNLTGIQDPEGHRWERYYDSKGNVVEATDPLGRVTKYEYSGAGLPVAIIDAKGGRQQIAWRPDGQMASFTDCSGKTSSWKYDARGHVIEARNAAGETTRYEYEAGQLVALIHPGGMREAFERDAEGRLLAHTDALNRRTQYRYSAAGLLAARVNALGDTLEYAWNRLGQIITLRNENGGEYRFAYDGYGRLVSEQDFDGRVTEYFREDGSGVVTHRRSGGVMQAFGYDAMGRVARRRGWKAQYTDAGRVFLEPVGGASVDEEVFAYDGFGRVLQAFNAHSGVWRAYDPVGNLEQERLHMRGSATRFVRSFIGMNTTNSMRARRPCGRMATGWTGSRTAPVTCTGCCSMV
ncbi:DUF6531 domain-containing protein [Paraburkholderia rhizosphaerae]|uniref:YD repeat-containing protein n=1 Tax=Paraburkholderia rhizosphaerae TaxID=480658 RepID=A0A4R8LT33_9BURK|nr:DUF6531 domain-containing protein [Paraburkholderia rhizosphaerae]TDY50849.1 YD repeat-containing protein [Paraburkholderia rhizosphaerae]